MAEVKTVICDVCQGSNAERWQIGQRGQKPWTIDLCPDHSKILSDYRTMGRGGEGGTRPYRRLAKVNVTPR